MMKTFLFIFKIMFSSLLTEVDIFYAQLIWDVQTNITLNCNSHVLKSIILGIINPEDIYYVISCHLIVIVDLTIKTNVILFKEYNFHTHTHKKILQCYISN